MVNIPKRSISPFETSPSSQSAAMGTGVAGFYRSWGHKIPFLVLRVRCSQQDGCSTWEWVRAASGCGWDDFKMCESLNLMPWNVFFLSSKYCQSCPVLACFFPTKLQPVLLTPWLGLAVIIIIICLQHKCKRVFSKGIPYMWFCPKRDDTRLVAACSWQSGKATF